MTDNLDTLGWAGKFRVHDPDPADDHGPIYLICPNGFMVNFSCDATPGLDAKRVQWVADTLNASALTTPGGDGKVMWSKNHMAADPRNSCDAVDPSPSPTLSREAVARIIDPSEWQGEGPNEFGRRASLAKADAILALALPPAPQGWRPAYENLRAHQRQLDQDGVEVGVSRQALDEVLNAIAAAPAPKGEG